MTDDELSRGTNQTTATGDSYRSVIQPNHIETVVAHLPTGRRGAMEKWKYSRYSDNPQFWSDPEDFGSQRLPPPAGEPRPRHERDVVTIVNGNINREGLKRAITTVKTQPVPDQTEAYNVTRDPLELHNLTRSPDPRSGPGSAS